jgi:hypothetical protein
MAGAPRNSEPHGNGGRQFGDERIEARLARIETTMDYVQRDVSELRTDVRDMRSEHRSDFRMLFSAIVTMALGMAAMMAKMFNWL